MLFLRNSVIRLSVTLALVLLTGARAQSKQKPTLDDLLTLKEITGPTLSPDGKWLAYMTFEGDVWIMSTESGSQPRLLGKGSLPTWSPDGSHLAYYSNKTGPLQLWLLNIRTYQAEQVTDIPTGITPDPLTTMIGWRGWYYDSLRLSWSPDGRRLVFASQVGTTHEAAVPPPTHKADTPLILTSKTPPEWTLHGIFRGGGFKPPRWINGKLDFYYPDDDHSSLPTKKVSQIFAVDIRNKHVVQLTNDEEQYFAPEWAPDGSSIVCVSMEGRPLLDYGSGPTNLYLVDVGTGKKHALTSDAEYKRMPHWSPDGKWVAYFSAQTLNYQFVSIIPSSGGAPIPITAKLDRDIREINWFPDSQSIIMTYLDGISDPIIRVAVPSGNVETISGTEPASRMWLSVSHSGVIVWIEGNGSSYSLIRALAPGANSPYVLLDPNPQIAGWILGKQQILHWKNSRGEELEGVLIEPPEYREGRKYPLIVDGYPALSSDFKGDPMWANQAWAERGYVLFFPDARAPHVWLNPFRATNFTSAGKGPEGLDVMADDILSGVDELIHEGIVDPDRMALYGFSNGGAVVEQMVTKTSRFKCAVAVGGATSVDWPRRFFLHTLEPWTTKLAETTPWENPRTFIQLSAVYRLDHVTTPMLLADGDDDGDFLLNTIEMYNGLRWLGRDVTFLRYPAQGHGFTGWAMRDFWEREATFFAKYLKPDQR